MVFWCVVFAYEGFVNGSTLTHGGFNSGLIARVYSVFYSLFALFSIALIPLYSQNLLQLDGSIILQSLLYVEPAGVGLVFVGIAILGFLFKFIILQFRKISRRMNKYRHKVYNSMLFFFGAAGIQNLISTPQWVLLCVFTFFIYFGAFTSPKTVIMAMKPNVGENFAYFKKTIDNSPQMIKKA